MTKIVTVYSQKPRAIGDSMTVGTPDGPAKGKIISLYAGDPRYRGTVIRMTPNGPVQKPVDMGEGYYRVSIPTGIAPSPALIMAIVGLAIIGTVMYFMVRFAIECGIERGLL